MIDSQHIPWKRLTMESGVIVASILLAFAIDAWWDERQERAAQLERLAGVAAEIERNIDIVDEILAVVDTAITSSSEYLSWSGPEPEPVTLEAFSKQTFSMLNIGMLSLVRRAADEYLGAGTAAGDEQKQVRAAILRWYSDGDNLLQQWDQLRNEHKEYTDHMNATIPQLRTLSATSVMDRHPQSKFPFDPADTLSDPKAESLAAVYLLRLEFVSAQARSFQQVQADLLALIKTNTDSSDVP